MTILEAIITCIGILSCVVVAVLGLIVCFGLLWWAFKTEVDITNEYQNEIES